MLRSELINTIEQFIVYVHQNEAHFTYIYVPKMSCHLYLLLFLFRSWAPPMTLRSAGAFTDRQLPATASNVCMTDAKLGGVGRVNPGYAGDSMSGPGIEPRTLACQTMC